MHKTRGGIKFVKSDVVSWYTGGAFPNPCSELVCSVRTGHAESMRITFAPSLITYTDLQHIFFTIHDPTTLNRQGNDGGTQYRSAIFTTLPSQQAFSRLAFISTL
jgi:peptide-methionine (S)-S-oxide reductase